MFCFANEEMCQLPSWAPLCAGVHRRQPHFDVLAGRRHRPCVMGRDVHFTYPSRPKEKVFTDLNLKVEPGTTVALVSAAL